MPDFHVYDLFELSSPIQIVDVGAADNKSTPEPYQFLMDRGIAQVVGFEPDEDACAAFNARSEGTRNRCYPYFVGDGNEATFYSLASPLCSSLYPPNHSVIDMFTGLEGLFREQRRDRVETTRLDDIADLGDVDFLKLDVQGGELDVLKGAPETLRNAMIVFSEVEFVELYEGQPLFGDIDVCLRENGFMFHMFAGAAYRAFRPMVVRGDPDSGLHQMLWGDALFIRDPRLFKNYSKDKLLKLALIMHEMVESYDVVLALLNTVDEQEGTTLSRDYLARFQGQPR